MFPHLKEAGQSYWQHLKYAFGFAWLLLQGAAVVLYHGVFPTMHSHYLGRYFIISAWQRLPGGDDKM